MHVDADDNKGHVIRNNSAILYGMLYSLIHIEITTLGVSAQFFLFSSTM
jgi:hypothetical protein